MISTRNNRTCLLALLMVCQAHHPLTAEEQASRSWRFEAEKGDINVGLNGVVEPDLDASEGKAVVAKVGRNLTKLFHRPLYKGPCSMVYPFGEYEAVFRMKVNATTNTQPVVRIELHREGTKYNDPVLGKWEFKPSDFNKADTYQSFPVRFEHVPYGWLQVHVIWLGGADFSLDNCDLRLLREFPDEEQAQRWPYAPLNLGKCEDPALAVVFLKGPLYQYQRVEDALAKIEGMRMYEAYMQKSYVFWNYSLDGYFPDINDHWYGLDLIILGGVDAEALGLKRRRRIAEFVRNCGGGLLMLPGPYSFGKGRFQGTAVEGVLPVTVGSPWDWKRFETPQAIEVTSEVPELTSGLDFGVSAPHTLWYTSAALRDGARVVLRVGDVPILVVSEVGQGRSAALLALPCGQIPDDQHPFWVTDAWQDMMRRLVLWLDKGATR